ncbi:DUF2585 domain-containing protein [Inquilinus limosus]|uniref:UPF0314 protein BWR60_16125 n=1 Tax=Inquilinus limosus TaxID=171674 RepID=A0A211ZLG7_9PROT|nr:DUF2585 domain-containing protein [Inquilinus limosus]OWJ66118.1 hypothetical protein BWR60_16125 [Inquilinus limosus]
MVNGSFKAVRPAGRITLLLGLGLVAATAAILLAMGRVPICTCGTVKLWAPDVMSADNSQHIADWYTPSHIIHGFLFFGLTRLFARRLPLGARALIALAVECAWEIAENSPMVIDRYREATIALGYTGDSVINSVSDIGFMTLGFFFAARAPVWLTIALAIFFELLTGWLIRDNLTLNVLMLLHPVDAIRVWQSGG